MNLWRHSVTQRSSPQPSQPILTMLCSLWMWMFFRPWKRFNQLLSELPISSKRDTRYEIFIMSVLITLSHDETLTIRNVNTGFRGSGTWPLRPDAGFARHEFRENSLNAAGQPDISTAQYLASFSSAAHMPANSHNLPKSFVNRHR